MKSLRLLMLVMPILLYGPASHAVAVDGDRLDDPQQEERARELSRGLRCLVCQNQSIEDSNAALAKDLRRIVRERIVAGDSDEEIYAYLVARYGDWVLMQPPVNDRTILLWLAPGLILLIGAVAVFVMIRRRPVVAEDAAPLSAEEQTKLDALSKKDDPS